MADKIKFCKSCNSVRAENFTFCPSCGNSLEEFVQAPAVSDEGADQPVDVSETDVETPAQVEVSEPEPQESTTNETGVSFEEPDDEFLGVELDDSDYSDGDYGHPHELYSKDDDEDRRGGGMSFTLVNDRQSETGKRLLISIGLFILFLGPTLWVGSLLNISLEAKGLNDDFMRARLLLEDPLAIPEKVEKIQPAKNKGKAGGGGGGDQTPVAVKGEPPKGRQAPENPRDQVPERVGLDREPKKEGSLFGNRLATEGRGPGRGPGFGSRTGSGDGGVGGDGLGNSSGPGQCLDPPCDDGPPPPIRRGETVNVKILSQPRASYTDSARQAGIQGKVVLRVTFQADGNIGAISAVSGLPNGLTERAIAAARSIRFEPAKRNGVPYSVTRTIEYSFTIY
jgi:TonB family protein